MIRKYKGYLYEAEKHFLEAMSLISSGLVNHQKIWTSTYYVPKTDEKRKMHDYYWLVDFEIGDARIIWKKGLLLGGYVCAVSTK